VAVSGAHCAKVWTAGEISMTAVGAVVDEVALGQAFVRVLPFFLSVEWQ